MSEKTKKEIISVVITLVATFLTTVGGLLSIGGGDLINSAFLTSLLIAGIRSGIKAVLESKLHSVAGISKV